MTERAVEKLGSSELIVQDAVSMTKDASGLHPTLKYFSIMIPKLRFHWLRRILTGIKRQNSENYPGAT